MFLFALHFSRRMIAALRLSKDRIGDINARVEDSLAGIRVVKSFTNEAFETARFNYENDRFLASRSEGYRSEAWFSGGMAAFTQLITIAVIVFGAAGIARAALDLADLLTFLMCVAVLVDPIRRLVNFARLYQEGITGFDRFFEMLQMEPDMPDQAGAAELTHVRGDINVPQRELPIRRRFPLRAEELISRDKSRRVCRAGRRFGRRQDHAVLADPAFL